MPGWWYTIESTTTKHLITQFEHACREALSSDRATRELLRAKSAKQRFPVVEWIRKLDKLQITAIKMSERGKKRPHTPNKGFRSSIFGTPPKSSSGSVTGLGISTSPQPSPGLPPPPRSPLGRDPRRESDVSSANSDSNEDLYDPSQHRPLGARDASSGSLRDLADDTSSIPELKNRGIIEPPPKGSSLSRKLSLGTRLGPGHVRQKKHESMATIESLGAIDEEQHYTMPGDDEDDEYMYSAAAIRRQLAKNQGSRRGGEYSDGGESSDQDSDFATPDSGSLYEFDPQRGSVYNLEHHGHNTDSMYFDEDQDSARDYFGNIPREPGHVGLGMYVAQEDAETDSQAPLTRMPLPTTYAGGLSPPVTPNLRRMEGSHLSLASVLGGRDDFALSKVDDMFTDADGKYFKMFSSELHKIDPKTSKDELCIEEFITKSEKEWSNDQRNKKLGLESNWGSDSKGHHHFTHKIPTAPSSQVSDDRPPTVSPPESQADEPLFGYKRPTGLKLFMQRRLGDWPVYSFLIALV